MMKSWSEAQRLMWEGWLDASRASAAENPYASAFEAWQQLAQRSLESWRGSGDTLNHTLTKEVAERTVASQRTFMQFLRLSTEAWQAMWPQLKNGGDWQKTLSGYTESLQKESAAQTAQDVAELWSLYLGETQKLAQIWLEPLSTPGGRYGNQSMVEDLIDRFWNAYDRTFARGLESPTIGYSREFNAKVLRAFNAWVEMRRAGTDYQALVGNIWLEAFRQVMERFVARAQEDEAPQDFKALFNFWIETADEVFVEAFRSQEYVESQGRLVNATMTYRLREREVQEEFLNAHNLPTRSELDETHRTIYELRKEVRALKRAQQSPDGKETEALKAELADLRAQLEAARGEALVQNLPLENYPQLTVEEIMSRLDGLSRYQVEQLRAFEVLHKNRKTLLEQLDRKLQEMNA